MRLQTFFPKVLVTLGLALVALPVHAQVIFVSPCNLEIPTGTIGILKVWVCIEGSISNGVAGARFRVAGVPPTWIATATPAGAATTEGDILGDGVNISFPCSAGIGQYLEIFTIALYAADERTDVLLSSTAVNPPLAPPYDCAFVYKCDGPTWTKICVGAHGSWINPRKFNCGLAVTARSWGEVKSLYN